MGWTGQGKIGHNLRVKRFNSKDKTYSKGIKTNNYLIWYFQRQLWKKKKEKDSDTLILLLTVYSLSLCQSQIQYQIHTIIQDHKLVVLKLIYQHLLLQTNFCLLMKEVIHITVQHNITRIDLFFKEVNNV